MTIVNKLLIASVVGALGMVKRRILVCQAYSAWRRGVFDVTPAKQLALKRRRGCRPEHRCSGPAASASMWRAAWLIGNVFR